MTAMGFTPYDDERPEGALHGAAARAAVERMNERTRRTPGWMQRGRPSSHEGVGSSLSDRDRRILEFERQWWKYAGAKEQAIRDLFDMSGTRYYQLLNGLIDDPQALAFDPMLVKRLRRMRASRQRARSARRLGIELETR